MVHQANSQKKLIAEEPGAAYGTATFANYSLQEIDQVPMSGKTLTAIQEKTTLTPQTITQALGISKSKYYDLLQTEDLDFKTKDALVDLAFLWEKGMEAFDQNQSNLIDWLNTTNENLGNIKPVNLFASRTGRRTLEQAFARIEYSLYG